jgi:hypothetical protein
MRYVLAVLAFVSIFSTARAELRDLKLYSRQSFAEGMSFGDTGPYEILRGVAHYAVDPSQLRNRAIVDLPLATRNADGKVEFEADVCILAPRDPTKGNGGLLYDVNNRGNKLALGMFNSGASSNNPNTKAHAGNGFLMRRGYTIVWCGWSGELLAGGDRLLLRAPIATEKGKTIRGVVRQELMTDLPATSLTLTRRENHGSYPPSALGEKSGTLTWRMHEKAQRVVIPRGQWTLERPAMPELNQGVAGTLPFLRLRLRLEAGFRPGYLYELIYEGEGPIVQGLGFAAVRDLVSYLRREKKWVIRRAYGFGVSQSGRFLRHFLYQGFNVDERDRKVFDGIMPHVAGGGLGSFNHRFAQPTRNQNQHEEHLFFGDGFPFNYGPSVDPFGERRDQICPEDSRFLPKVMHTQSAAEYWHRAGSLVHTDPLGTRDAEIPANVRVYAFGGTQHGPAGFPPKQGFGDNLPNPGDYRPFLRALLDAMDAWVRDGTEPPPSLYPHLSDKTLVSWQQQHTGFPAIPGVRYPEVIHQPCALDFGPDFLTKGIISIQPPRIVGRYAVNVPKCDPDGNDLGTLLPPEVAVPLATFTGWNLRRHEVGAEGALASLQGSYLPFPKTAEERKKRGDPRPSLAERYGTFENYRERFERVCADLVRRRYLLDEDCLRLLNQRIQWKERFPSGP